MDKQPPLMPECVFVHRDFKGYLAVSEKEINPETLSRLREYKFVRADLVQSPDTVTLTIDWEELEMNLHEGDPKYGSHKSYWDKQAAYNRGVKSALEAVRAIIEKREKE